MRFCIRIEKSGETLFQAIGRDIKSILFMLPIAFILRLLLIRNNLNSKAINIILLIIIAIPIAVFRVVSELNPKVIYYLKNFTLENLPKLTATDKIASFFMQDELISNVLVCYGLQYKNFIELNNSIAATDAKSLLWRGETQWLIRSQS